MKLIFKIILPLIILLFNFNCLAKNEKSGKPAQIKKNIAIKLPAPCYNSKVSLEKALYKRRSIRNYSDDSLSISDVSQIIWAAQGITKKAGGLRTAPSAGALYPIELYIAVGKVKGLSQGVYKYNPKSHTITKILEGDIRDKLSNAALKQNCIRRGAVNIIIVGVYKRTAVKYGKRAEHYVLMECGAVSQNIYLQSCALDLGTVLVGAFNDDALKSILKMPEDEYPLAIMPIGRNIKAGK